MSLPDFLLVDEERPGCYVIDPDVCYPPIITALKELAENYALDPHAEPDLTAVFRRMTAIAISEGADPDLMVGDYWAALRDESNRFQFEVAYQIAKLDTRAAIGVAGLPQPLEIRVRADDGRKARWKQAGRPEGAPMPGHMVERSQLVRAIYRRLRGFVPS